MLAYPIATALLLLGQGSSVAARKKKRGRRLKSKPHPEKPSFLRKMDGHKKHARRRLSVKELQKELLGDAKESAELRKKMIEKSTVVKPPGGDGNKRKLQNYYNYNNNANNDNDANNANNANGYNANAKYNTYNNRYGGNANQVNGYYNGQQGNYNNQFYNDANNAYNYAAQNNGNYVYDQDGNLQYKYNRDRDGIDDYFQAYGDWENAFGFDPTQFSLSYHRCAAVRQFDDEIAAEEDTDSVFATMYFAIFRFCPAQTCMGWQAEEYEWECDEDLYGESYCEALEEYMEVMEEMAENYQQYGQGWNGYNQNGNGQQQANNWMYANYNGNYDYGEMKYDQYGNPYGQQWANCECNQDAEAEDEEQADGEDEEQADGEGEEQERCNCYQQDEDDYYYGARGEGCDANYGEYMMEMEEYLEVMLEWQEERFEQYCMYCEECMFNVYEEWLQNGGNRKLEFEEFKNSEEHRNLGNYYNVCPEYDTCAEYSKICQQGEQDEYSDYFECTEVQASSGMEAYVGPKCAEDGFTITLGIYADEYCNEYIGNGVEIANFLGEEIDYEQDMLKDYYNSAYGTTLSQLKYINDENVCIPCAASDLMWTERGNGGDDDDGYNKGNEINEFCESVYEVSARCDKHFRSYNNKSKQAKYAEAVAQEDLACDFIDSIVMGNYNEMGEIDMGDSYAKRQQSAGWLANNMYAQQFGQTVSEVTPLQIFLLIASIAAVCILAMWSMTLHKSLMKTGPWKPRRGIRSPAPVHNHAAAADLSRQNSGIVMGRSNSNTSYYMS